MNEQDIKKEKTTWYLMGKTKGVKEGTHNVVFEEGTDYTFTDTNTDGNVVIAVEE